MKSKIKPIVILIALMLITSANFAAAAPPELVSLENDYIKIIVNPGPESLGRFAIEVTGGDPGRPGDDQKTLIYGRPKPWTSFTTVQIDGENYVFGGKTDTRAGRDGLFGEALSGPTAGDDSITTICKLGPFQVTQTLSFVKSSTTGLPDTVQIKYTLTNKGTEPHKAGIRILLDTMLGENDGAPFRVSDQAILTDHLFVKGNLPAFWQAFDSLSKPQVIAQGTVEGPNVVTPDKIYFSNWGSMADGLWDFNFQTGRDFTRAGELELDSALALYYAPMAIGPGESRTIVSNFGLGGITLVPGLLSVGVTSPAQVVLEYERASFPIIAYVQNTSEITAKDVKISLQLPQGFTLSEGEVSRELGDLKPQEISQVAWEILPPASEIPAEMTYKVEVSATNTDSNAVERTIDFIGPPHLTAEFIAPEELAAVEHRLEPNPFQVQAVIKNSGESTAFLVASKLILPPGLDFAPREMSEKLLGDIQAGEELRVPWSIEVLGGKGQLPYALELKGINIPEFSEVKFVQIPDLSSGLTFGEYNGQYKAGRIISVPVLISGMQNSRLDQIKFDFEYDPEVLDFIRYSRGTLFIQGEDKLRFFTPEFTLGSIKGLGGNLPGTIRKAEVITTLHFLVKQAQETTLIIKPDEESPFGSTELTLEPKNN
ncbi:MAG: cohesin domain-containing protein [Halanaerobium sp.]|nr:cohesin domain-containing protein [Halanaerobium sp.]